MENTSGKTLKELLDIFFSFPDEAGEFRYRSGRFYEFAGALGRCEENSPQCALLVNAIEREFSEGVFYQQFAGAVFDAIVDFGVLPQEMRDFERSPKVAFLIESGDNFLSQGFLASDPAHKTVHAFLSRGTMRKRKRGRFAFFFTQNDLVCFIFR